MTFPNLHQILQTQPSFLGSSSPQYGPSYSLVSQHCSISQDQEDTLKKKPNSTRAQPPKLPNDHLFPSFPLPVEENKQTTQPKKKRLLRSNAHSAPAASTTTATLSSPNSTPIKSSEIHKTTPSSLLSMECFQDLLSQSCLHELKRWFTRRSSGLGSSSSPHAPSPSSSTFSSSMNSSGTIMKQWQEDSPRLPTLIKRTSNLREPTEEEEERNEKLKLKKLTMRQLLTLVKRSNWKSKRSHPPQVFLAILPQRSPIHRNRENGNQWCLRSKNLKRIEKSNSQYRPLLLHRLRLLRL
jgi:hypothetical protein